MAADRTVGGPAVHQVVETVQGLFAAVRDQRHFNFIPRLETNGRGGRDVQALAEGRSAVKFQGAVNFEKVKVRADLNRAVAGVAYFDLGYCTVFVERDRRAGVDAAAQWNVAFIAGGDPAWVFGVGDMVVRMGVLMR